MNRVVKDTEWSNVKEGVPAFMTMLLMPLTYSIIDGILADVNVLQRESFSLHPNSTSNRLAIFYLTSNFRNANSTRLYPPSPLGLYGIMPRFETVCAALSVQTEWRSKFSGSGPSYEQPHTTH
ncbi:adenine/guanine permease AZG2 [Cinnamomum micranthum f. kanehirae]|uniref:Adenine/guanine permease AZG2 n=1 Tax=Cinnamomum micranthum f. kanehirae TaxID=337451 RepID=A0A3S3PA88_9MAGN|nr:adenine/guanine permease AZG2 [Cinnamomum micranthum f. kanehirae]